MDECRGGGSGDGDPGRGGETAEAARGDRAAGDRGPAGETAGAALPGVRHGGTGVGALRQAAEQRHRRRCSAGGSGTGAGTLPRLRADAREKLVEVHGHRLSVGALRGWMIADGLWRAKARRAVRVHQNRPQGAGSSVWCSRSPNRPARTGRAGTGGARTGRPEDLRRTAVCASTPESVPSALTSITPTTSKTHVQRVVRRPEAGLHRELAHGYSRARREIHFSEILHEPTRRFEVRIDLPAGGFWGRFRHLTPLPTRITLARLQVDNAPPAGRPPPLRPGEPTGPRQASLLKPYASFARASRSAQRSMSTPNGSASSSSMPSSTILR